MRRRKEKEIDGGWGDCVSGWVGGWISTLAPPPAGRQVSPALASSNRVEIWKATSTVSPSFPSSSASRVRMSLMDTATC